MTVFYATFLNTGLDVLSRNDGFTTIPITINDDIYVLQNHISHSKLLNIWRGAVDKAIELQPENTTLIELKIVQV